MRVIAGQHRGRRLLTPAGSNTRPILDRVKASLFDWLGSRLAMPGHLPPLNVCDIFCGAGSLGIECLSRGAAFCAFVETDAAALDALRRNLAALAVGDKARIFSTPAQGLQLTRHTGNGFGLVFLDPPYALSRDLSSGSIMSLVIERLGQSVPLEPDTLMLWRHDIGDTLPNKLPGGWSSNQRREWGSMAVTMFERGSEETC